MNELDDFLLNQQSDEGDSGAFEEDLEPEETEEEPDEEVTNGKVCSLCGTEFTEEHGHPVVCKDCSGNEAAQGIKTATFPEVIGG